MSAAHPDLEAEQHYIDRAYEYLEETRETASKMRNLVEVGRGGTNQARFEREVIYDTMVNRLSQLQLGDAALCFGRIDFADGEAPGDGGQTFYIGRIAVSDDDQEPVIVDWRAPVAEAFYRATGRQPMGLARRRHFATRGREVLAIEDELFGDALAALGIDGDGEAAGPTIKGHGALISALESARTGKLGDIVATIQGEQDEIIRAELPGVMVVQGGPGTGKTVVALHRAAYLLYTFRFPLEGQGVLVVGPNRLFLNYIDQVLPSLGEAGVELVVLADLVADPVRVQGFDKGTAARVKGDLRMAKLLQRAVRQRQRPLREPLVVGFGVQHLRLPVEESRRIVDTARRRYRKHNAGRKFVEGELFEALARRGRGDLDPAEVRERLRHTLEIRMALEWMWPVLTPAQFLHDFFGSRALLRAAATDLLRDEEWLALHRKRSDDLDSVVWSNDDAPLLDEARALLGPKPRSKRQRQRILAETGIPDDEVRTYGHIVVDEAQDLSPMQLRMLNRRSLSGSMTIVGDIAQSTGQWAHATWEEILEHLPDKRPPRREELSIGYRLPAPIMAVASRVLREAAPQLDPPSSVREDGASPSWVTAPEGTLAETAVRTAIAELDELGVGSVAVISPDSLVDDLAAALDAAGVDYGRATRHGLDSPITLVPVSLVKGLELDGSVVVEPAAILEEEAQGARALYVALTRATRRLAVVHERPLPTVLEE